MKFVLVADIFSMSALMKNLHIYSDHHQNLNNKTHKISFCSSVAFCIFRVTNEQKH